jgi:hypothetical protein
MISFWRCCDYLNIQSAKLPDGQQWNFYFHDYSYLYSLANTRIIPVIKSGRMGWAEHVARMGDRRDAYRILVDILGKGSLWKD